MPPCLLQRAADLKVILGLFCDADDSRPFRKCDLLYAARSTHDWRVAAARRVTKELDYILPNWEAETLARLAREPR